MSRFYVPAESVKGNSITISGKEAHHIIDVMRLKKLDKVVTFDGTGREYVGFIKEIKHRALIVEIVETRSPFGRASYRITLIQAIPKKDKMDYIVEKSTELGVHSIVPVITNRTVPAWDGSKMDAHVERWRKIAKEAAKQCGRADLPAVCEITNFHDAMKNASDYDFKLIAALSDEAVPFKSALDNFNGGRVGVAIGPEGDFTPAEVKEAKEAGFMVASLGSRVLKSDTASLAVLAILNYEFTN